MKVTQARKIEQVIKRRYNIMREELLSQLVTDLLKLPKETEVEAAEAKKLAAKFDKLNERYTKLRAEASVLLKEIDKLGYRVDNVFTSSTGRAEFPPVTLKAKADKDWDSKRRLDALLSRDKLSSHDWRSLNYAMNYSWSDAHNRLIEEVEAKLKAADTFIHETAILRLYASEDGEATLEALASDLEAILS